MNTLELDRCLKNNKYTKKIYKGTFAADLIPYKKHTKSNFLVINDEPSNLSGSHWIGIYITDNTLELFDTGGRSFLHNTYIRKFIKFHSNKKFVYNKNQIQHLESDLCGQFVCLFGLAKAKNISFKKFLSIFTFKNLKNNNFIVLNIFKNHFDCIKIVCGNRFKNINNYKIQICNKLKYSS